MLPSERVTAVAEFLYSGISKGGTLPAVPPDIAPTNSDEAYAVQQALIERLTGKLGPVIGYKVALTTKAVQEFFGMSEPAAGEMNEKTVHKSPAEIHAADFVSLALEFELAVRLLKDIPRAEVKYNRESIEEYVGELLPAFELVENRWDTEFSKWDGMAVNSLYGGAVLGSPIADWHSIDLTAVRGTASINGETVGTGIGGDVLGHPFEALAWLANHLGDRGRPLRAGMTVLTGSFIAPKPLASGDSARFAIEGIGDVLLTVT